MCPQSALIILYIASLCLIYMVRSKVWVYSSHGTECCLGVHLEVQCMEGSAMYEGKCNVWREVQCMEGSAMYGGKYNVWREVQCMERSALYGRKVG